MSTAAKEEPTWKGVNEKLIEIEKNYDEDFVTPTVKELSSALGISYARVEKQLEQIYKDIIMNVDSFEITEIEYCFELYR